MRLTGAPGLCAPDLCAWPVRLAGALWERSGDVVLGDVVLVDVVLGDVFLASLMLFGLCSCNLLRRLM